LHWNLFPEACYPGADGSAWSASVPFAVNGVPTRALCPTDLLLAVCGRSANWSPIAPAFWIADALTLLGDPQVRIDWQRVVVLARHWHLLPHLRDTLGYLAHRWDAPIPQPVLEQLRGAHIGSIDRRAYGVLGEMPGPLRYLARPWVRYRLRTREVSALRALPGFLRYMRITLGCDSALTLAREVARRYLSWRTDRARGLR